MNDSFNPFSHWLGLHDDVRRPHHFQLLGIDPLTNDAKVIKAAARARLQQLSQVEPGDKVELLNELKKRVLIAHRVLSNPESREIKNWTRRRPCTPRAMFRRHRKLRTHMTRTNPLNQQLQPHGFSGITVCKVRLMHPLLNLSVHRMT
jgi:hypothetical protein